jgi:hypothetical protein
MQSLAEQSLHKVSTVSGALKAESTNTEEPDLAFGVAREQKWREAKNSLSAGLRSRKWQWGVAGGCAGTVLILFGLFHSWPVSESRMASLTKSAALRDLSATTMKMAPTQRASTSVNIAGGAAEVTGPMIARTVSLTIQVKDVAASRSALDAILARYQGYAAELSINTPENAARSFGASLRIPAPALTAALADLRKLGRVQGESQSGEEVTQQHMDLAARLRNARETEQRLLAILERRTGKVADVLAVEEQISNTRGEIERMEAELNLLEHRVDFAAVQLQLAEEFKAQLNPSSASVGTQMHNAFVTGLGNAGDAVLGIVLFFGEYGPVLLVWLIVLGTPAWLVWRRFRKAESRA